VKLYLEAQSERNSRSAKKGGNEFVFIELMVKNRKVGEIELYLFNDIEQYRAEGCEEDEWLIKHRRGVHEDEDWNIIDQGNL